MTVPACHRKSVTVSKILISTGVIAGLALTGVPAYGGGEEPEHSSGVERVEHDASVFRSDPSYEEKPYDIDAQIQIYGGKRGFDQPRPLLEAGREIYVSGPFQDWPKLLGEKNPLAPHFYIYGDLQTVVGFADNGAAELAQVAARLTLDLDLGITSTERIHAVVRPLDRGGQFTRYEFGGGNKDEGFEDELNGNLDALFFEGDMGAIAQGVSGEFNTLDLPFAVGFMPLLLQNGVWLEDALVGAAVTVPALNSPELDVSNADFTAFVAFDKVDTPASVDEQGGLDEHRTNIYALAGFVEALEGYIEFGYGYVDGQDFQNNFDYSNLTVSYTRRYRNWFSNSVRLIWNVGQDPDDGVSQTADGFLVLLENSLITHLPTVLVPYFNMWVGVDKPQALAQQARGVLRNTGINFETDAITQFPKLDDTAANTFGGALGIEYLFNLDYDHQIVAEVATVHVMGGRNDPDRAARDDQYAIGFRYQLPITDAWIVRVDSMYGFLDNEDDLAGARLEIRRKF